MTAQLQSFRSSDRVHMAYLDLGKGTQTIVFVHGLTGSIPAWEPTYSFFSLYYRCIVVDLPGHGQSETGNYSYTPAFYAAALKELLTQLNIWNPVLVGHSMGGHILLELLLHHSYSASHLVLSAPAGLEQFSTEEYRLLLILTGTQVPMGMQGRLGGGSGGYFFESSNPLFKAVRKSLEEGTLRMQNNPIQVISKSIKGMLENPVLDQASALEIPIFVVFGLDDNLIPNKLVHKMDIRAVASNASLYLRTASFEFYPNCGHMPHLEHSDYFNLYMYKSINKHLYTT